MTVLLISSCSNRKTVRANERLSAAILPNGPQPKVAAAWKNQLKTHRPRVVTGEFYSGRGFLEAKKASSKLNADHWVVSAGLGLIHIDEEIPAYDVTVSGNGSTSIRNKIAGGAFDIQDWWLALTSRKRPSRSLSTLIENRSNKLVVLALPSNYFQMVSADLASLSPDHLKKIRIVGPTASSISERFEPFRLPYDERLDGPTSPIPGTRSDFPQRAAHHFAEFVWPVSRTATAKKHAELVLSSMATMAFPNIPKREKKTDDEIISLIIANWQLASGQSRRMLRILRDKELIACEQKRFVSLFYVAKQQLETS